MNRRAYALGVVMVLLGSLVAIALKSFAEATFLATYGAAKVPWLLIANAGGFAVATLGYDWLLRHADARKVDLGLLGVLGVAAGIAPLLLDAGAPPVLIVVGLAAASQVAGLALWNRVAASVAGRDARRMLPRAGAAGTAGAAIAGLGAGALIPRVGLSVIPYIGAAVTAVLIAVSLGQEKALTSGGAPGATAPPGAATSLGAVHRPLLRALIALSILEAVVSTVVDLQFTATLKGHYQGEALAVAIAMFYGGTNGILLLLQVLAVPRLLVTRSLPFTMAIHPILVMLGYGAFVAGPTFAGIATTRTTDQVLRAATSRTAQEISLSAFPPGPRARWKVLLRGAAWPTGAVIAAAALLAIGPAALANPQALAGTAMAIAVAWWVASQIAARRFQTALAAPLGIVAAVRRADPRRIDLASLERWTEVAGGDDARAAGLARAALTRARVDASDLADHLRHDSPAVRAALFDQVLRAPDPTLTRELRAAVAIEDDDRALALGIAALALAGDDTGLARGRSRAGLSREVDDAVGAAELTLGGSQDPAAVRAQVIALAAREPRWAATLAARLAPAELAAAMRDAGPGGYAVIARVGTGDALALLAGALERGEPDATAAIAALDEAGAAHLAKQLPALSPLVRAAIARARAGAPACAALVGALLADGDPEVAYAALRTALAIARGGGEVPAAPIATAHEVARAALVSHLDARDATSTWSSCARTELELATRRCMARLLWAGAVEAAAAGRDPAPLTATARVLINGREADRRRALDVVQELQAGRAEILPVIERWLRPAGSGGDARALATYDPWLARLGAGELAAQEPILATLRATGLFSSIAAVALVELAARAERRAVTGTLFERGAPGDAMYVVASGALLARRDTERRIEPGGVVGELAVLTHAPRAATVVAAEGGAEVLVIDRATFAAAARRAPELVLGLSALLAGWIAPDRPDLL